LDIFVHDPVTGATTRVSVDSAGNEADMESYAPAISADGRYVAFESGADNLVAGDTNGSSDIFVHDTVTGATTRASVDSAGNEADMESYAPAISADGRYVAFHSYASNLVPGDTNDATDIFLHDMVTGTTTRVSVDSYGYQGDSDSYDASISADGRYVAFDSDAETLIPYEDVNENGLLDAGEDVNGNGILDGDTNWSSDIFVHDMLTGVTGRVSVVVDGREADGSSYEPAISADGRYVAFSSDAPNLVPPGFFGSGTQQVFVTEVMLWGPPAPAVTATASVDSDGNPGEDYSYGSAISSDGRYVAFTSAADNLVPGDTNGAEDIFVHDMVTGTTTRASVDSVGKEAD